MNISPILSDGIPGIGANLEVIVTHADLTQGTAATAQVLPIFNAAANYQLVKLERTELLEAFEDTADAANNTTAVTVGDGASAARYLASQELNRNGTEVYIKAGTGTAFAYTADDTVDITFAAPAAGKTLLALNKGKLRLLFSVYDTRVASGS